MVNIMNNKVIKLILAQEENDHVDFKKQFYSKEKKYDLIKDIVSLANNTKPIDKYIVFGVENSSWTVTGITASDIPDVSEINELLHMYVEPFIDIEVKTFDYQGVTIGYIYIPHSGLNRPYIISKEYSKNKLTSLRKGEIYIRKGATNFIADRSDIDNIYINKGHLEISFYTKEILFGYIYINAKPHLFGQARCIVQNNASKTIVIDGMSLFIHCGNMLLEPEVDFLDIQKNIYNKKPDSLSEVPLSVISGDCIQKTVYFPMSETAAINLKQKIDTDTKINAFIQVCDVKNQTYRNNEEEIELKFSEDLLKKWEL